MHFAVVEVAATLALFAVVFILVDIVIAFLLLRLLLLLLVVISHCLVQWCLIAKHYFNM